jgi:hypothetical protein
MQMLLEASLKLQTQLCRLLRELTRTLSFLSSFGSAALPE